MDWLNYHHLLYFWTVAKEGSVAAACRKLALSQPTISGQLRVLEDSLGEKLLARSGRGLVMTDVGKIVFRYADDIFGLGREMLETLKGRPTGKPLKLTVGVSDVVPKLIAYRVLKPALQLPESVRIVCFENTTERLLASLALHDLDIVLSDAPAYQSMKLKAYSHLLGECGIVLMGAEALLARYRRNFPRCLEKAPFLLPIEGTSLRRSLDQWFEQQGVRPHIVGEFEDSALLKSFGKEGLGLFAAPDVVAKEIADAYDVSVLKSIPSVRERFYAISGERRLQHPAVLAVAEAARKKLFGD